MLLEIFRNFLTKFQLKKCDYRAVQRSALCRSRRELSNAYFLAKFRFDAAENEPAKNLQKFAKFANSADPNSLTRYTRSLTTAEDREASPLRDPSPVRVITGKDFAKIVDRLSPPAWKMHFSLRKFISRRHDDEDATNFSKYLLVLHFVTV